MDTRIDLFLSFHGSESLRAGFTTRQLASAACKSIQKQAHRHSAIPSIFFDEHGAPSELTSSIFPAILQTRGGGLGLCLLTRSYFRQTWCVSELRALLAMRDEDPSVELRFVCLDDRPKDILEDPVIKRLVPQLGEFVLISSLDTSSLQRAAEGLANLVWKVWEGKDGLFSHLKPRVLGDTRERSFLHLQQAFYPEDVSMMCTVFGIPNVGTDVQIAFSMARDRGFIGYDDLSELTTVITHRNSPHAAKQRRIVKSYEQKWIESETLGWGQAELSRLCAIKEQTRLDIQRAEEDANGTAVNLDLTQPTTQGLWRDEEYYVIRQGDILWDIAMREYGNPLRWKEILDANKDVIPDEYSLVEGMTIVIPGRTSGSQ